MALTFRRATQRKSAPHVTAGRPDRPDRPVRATQAPPCARTVAIDDRAGSRELILLPPLDSIAKLVRLRSADISLVGNGPDETPMLVGVEYKSIFDLLASISTGRLQATQFARMIEDYDILYLLYYGEYRCGANGDLQVAKRRDYSSLARYTTHKIGARVVPYGYLEKFLFTASALGVRVKHVAFPIEAAEWVGCLARWWEKPWAAHRSLHTFDNSRAMSLTPFKAGDDPILAKVAAALPGIGFGRALAVARHFPSIEAMIEAPAEEWARVAGIGKVIAASVRRAITATRRGAR